MVAGNSNKTTSTLISKNAITTTKIIRKNTNHHHTTALESEGNVEWRKKFGRSPPKKRKILSLKKNLITKRQREL